MGTKRDDHKPLEGRRVVVTRAPEQAVALAGALQCLGAEVLLLPTLRFAAPQNWSEADEAIARLHEFNWILFTSQNAVRFFAQRLREKISSGIAQKMMTAQVAALGPSTAAVARQEGFSVAFIAKNYSADGLVAGLAGAIGGSKVLVPRGDRGDQRLPNALRDVGAVVTEAIAYRTAAPEGLDSEILSCVRRAEVDAITFASPSAFHNLCDVISVSELAELSKRIQFAVIGPTTARALKEGLVRVAIEANESSSAALADAIAKYYERQQPLVGGHL